LWGPVGGKKNPPRKRSPFDGYEEVGRSKGSKGPSVNKRLHWPRKKYAHGVQIRRPWAREGKEKGVDGQSVKGNERALVAGGKGGPSDRGGFSRGDAKDIWTLTVARVGKKKS